MNENIDKDSQISGNLATQLLGIVAGFFGLIAPQMVKKFNRRSLIVHGYLNVTILLGLLSLFIHIGQGYLAVSIMYVYIINNALCVASTLWIYVPEILNDAQYGFALTFHYIQAVEISAVTESMMFSLRPEGTFLFYSLLNFFVFSFFFIYLKETKGLTDRQKKQLYMPEEFKEAEIELASSSAAQEAPAPEDEEDYDELDQTTIATESIDIDYEEGDQGNSKGI